MFGRNTVSPDTAPVVANPADKDDVTRTNLVNTFDQTEHDVTTVKGHRVDIDRQTETGNRTTGQYDDRFNDQVMTLIESFDRDRQAKEDARANHRNFNRMLVLLVALVAGFVVVWTLNSGLMGSLGPVLAPYAFVITVLLDSGLALYSYIRKY
jgi:hypothetical protein